MKIVNFERRLNWMLHRNNRPADTSTHSIRALPAEFGFCVRRAAEHTMSTHIAHTKSAKVEIIVDARNWMKMTALAALRMWRHWQWQRYRTSTPDNNNGLLSTVLHQ